MLRERAATIGIKGPFLPDLAENLACSAHFAGCGVFQYEDIKIVRDDVFMLGKDATYKNNRLAVANIRSRVATRC